MVQPKSQRQSRKLPLADDLIVLKTNEYKAFLDLQIEAGCPVFAWSDPGVGKTEINRDVISGYQDMMYVETRFCGRDIADAYGLPNVTPTGLSGYRRPEMIPPLHSGKRIAWFLDGINRNTIQMLNVALQPVRDKMIGEHQLPKDMFVMAAGNFEDDPGVTRTSSAFNLRWKHVCVIPDLHDWCSWAAPAGIEPAIITSGGRIRGATALSTADPVIGQRAHRAIGGRRARTFGAREATMMETMMESTVRVPAIMHLRPISSEEEALDLLHSDGWIAEPKFDGDRVLISVEDDRVMAKSRQDKPALIETCIQDEVRRLAEGRKLVLDGEWMPDQTYVAFDVLQDGRRELWREPASYRVGYVQSLVKRTPCRSVLATIAALTAKEKQRLWDNLWLSGLEGVVLKKGSAAYSEGRSYVAQKFKFWNTASVIVTGQHQGKDSVEVELADGRPVGCVTTVGKVMPKPGEVIEVRYLHLPSKGGRLYQPEFLRVRNDVERSECTEAQLYVKGALRG